MESVRLLITALEVIANGNPVSVGLDQITQVAQNALNHFKDKKQEPVFIAFGEDLDKDIVFEDKNDCIDYCKKHDTGWAPSTIHYKKI